jgi:DNA repair exonuclease SbcCD nuclease subunit
MRKQVVAILCADIHLTLKPPLARMKEEDWLDAQYRPLKQMRDLADKYEVPILCAGDVFDRWHSSAELINWALDHLPKMYAIPGQHDLPTHNYELIHKSAYQTLAKADCGLIDLVPYDVCEINDLHVEAFPWGHHLTQPQHSNYKQLKIALVHQYVWIVGKTYPGAPMDAMLRKGSKGLKGWDVVVYGDNHKGFITTKGKTTVFNCGTLQRRKSDEIGYKPQVGLLYSDGSVKPHYLDTSSDIIEETSSSREVKEDMELEEFLGELTKLQDSSLDFEETMKRVLRDRKPPKQVRQLVLEAMK